jgi:hypothetical protein
LNFAPFVALCVFARNWLLINGFSFTQRRKDKSEDAKKMKLGHYPKSVWSGAMRTRFRRDGNEV